MRAEAGSMVAVLSQALDFVSEGVGIIDAEGRIIFLNRAAEVLEELSRTDVLGRHLKEIYRLSEDTSLQLETLKSGRPIVDKYHSYTTSKGKKVSVVASTFPVRFNGRVAAVVATARDVTLVKELLDTNARLVRTAVGGTVRPAAEQGAGYTFDAVIGRSAAMREAVLLARRTARSFSNVLLYGETGTGKELFAQSIHNASNNREGPFIGLNCAAIPEALLEGLLFGTVRGAFTGALDNPGLFVQAGTGTVFLDEVNSMPLAAQAKLLRVLEERVVQRLGDWKAVPVSCRIISSTNVDPDVAVKTGTLRQDLFYRLGTVVIHLPALRHRSSDIPVLVEHFLEKYNRLLGLELTGPDQELADMLARYEWPGNVRELAHMIESAMNLAGPGDKLLSVRHLPRYALNRMRQRPRGGAGDPCPPGEMALPEYLRRVEQDLVEKALAESGSNITRAARALGIKRQNLQTRLKKLGLARNFAE